MEHDSLEIPIVFPPTLPHPDSFSIHCVVGKMAIEKALCDLGARVSRMPYSSFHRLHLGLLRPAPFSLQLANDSEMRPSGKLENMPAMIGDTWVLEGFIIANMTEIDDTQIILGRPFLAT